MTLYVFLGPSLPLAEARLRAAKERPFAIGIVDGYFERVPAVWHKEILWALANGVAVAGAASMGALRAAELAPFGMIGVGRIFEAYARGVFPPFDSEPFEDDDEVAVVHGPAEAGWMATEAMVNIRATLAAAAEAGVVEVSLRDRLTAAAKAMFYKDRSWATLLHRAGADGTDANALARLRAWLPGGRIDQKRLDAVALLQRLGADRAWTPEARFAFADTTLWRRAVALPADDTDEAILVELRLTGDAWRETRDAAWAAIMGENGGIAEDPLPDPAAEADPACALAALQAFAERESRRREQAAAAGPLLDAAILSRLHGDGRYGALQARAMAKRQLPAAGADPLDQPTTDELLAWFAAHIGVAAPAEADALAAAFDFADAADLLRALADEWRFVRAMES